MLPWLQGRPSDGSVTALPLGPVEEEESEVGLRAMAMKAIAQDLLAAVESKDVGKLARVLDCYAECLNEI